jgi:[ribosomal protein S5]-alanine N-acetyltransferase
MHELTEIIVTPRLRLRSPAPSDLQLLHDHILSDAAVMRLTFSGRPMSPSQSREFIDRNFDHDASGKRLNVLVERATEQVIGFAGLLQCDVLGRADYEIGFVLRRSVWGRGYATEIARGQLEYGFKALGLTRLLALVSPKNSASITVLKKIGMKFHSTAHSDQRGVRLVYVAQRLRGVGTAG